MIYTVKRIDEDLNFGCEERPDGAPVMAIVTLVDSSGKEVTVKPEDAKLYECNINELILYASLFEKALCLSCIITFLCPKYLNIHIHFPFP